MLRTQIPAKLLVESAARVGFAIASEESRYTLIGGLLVIRPDGWTIVSTDGHWLACDRQGQVFEGLMAR